jgi:hypothetical protein
LTSRNFAVIAATQSLWLFPVSASLRLVLVHFKLDLKNALLQEALAGEIARL